MQKSKEEKEKSFITSNQEERENAKECALPGRTFFSPGSWMEASVQYRTIPTREYKTNKKAQISIQAIQVLAKS